MTFKFKKIQITDEHSAMKVGVDAVLLAAWTDLHAGDTVLDIGSGCGLIALLLASKYTDISVEGIEKDELAHQDALFNLSNNSFLAPCNFICEDFLRLSSEQSYTTFVSNPPYFKGEDINLTLNRRWARFEQYLPLEDLFKQITQLATPKAAIYLIYPAQFLHDLTTKAHKYQWFLQKKCLVYGNSNSKAAKRVLVCFVNNFVESVQESELIIEETRGKYTKEYINLCKDFYINF